MTSGDPSAPDVEYQSLDESICTVDDHGSITAEGVGVCRVRLIAKAEGYRDVAIDKTVNVLPLSQLTALEWSSFQ